MYTDKNGEIVIKDIPIGHYIVKEVTAPQNYILNDFPGIIYLFIYYSLIHFINIYYYLFIYLLFIYSSTFIIYLLIKYNQLKLNR